MARKIDAETQKVHDKPAAEMAAAADRLQAQGRRREANATRTALTVMEMSVAETTGEFGPGGWRGNPGLPCGVRSQVSRAGGARGGALPGQMIDYCRAALSHVAANRAFSSTPVMPILREP
jgi:hypothetical protein